MNDSSVSALVTGASGTIGQHLCLFLEGNGYNVTRLVRPSSLPEKFGHKVLSCDIRDVRMSDIERIKPDVVIHCAAYKRNQVSKKGSINELFALNVDGTLNLAHCCLQAGVKRFVFLSSAKAVGEYSVTGKALRTSSAMSPLTAYGKSKAKAEIGLRSLLHDSKMELVIIRPPMVYSPQPQGNMLSILKLVDLGLPIPFNGLDNRRSMISLDNLVEFIELCLINPKVAGGCYFVADGEPISTSQIFSLLIKCRGSNSKLFDGRIMLLREVLGFLGLTSVVQRLYESLELDISEAIDTLGWTPSHTTCEGLVKYYSSPS